MVSNYEETKADILKSFSSSKDKSIIEACATLIEAQSADVEEALEELGDENVALRVRVLEAMVNHAWKIVLGYAGFAVAMGQKVGTIDQDGDPTDKMPEGLTESLTSLNEQLAQFKDAYEDFIEGDDDDVSAGEEKTEEKGE